MYKKNFAKKVLGFAMSAAIVLGAFNQIEVQASEDLILWVDGRYIQADANPYIEEGRTLVPVRFIAESLDYKVQWRPEDRTVIISDDDDTIVMTIGSNIARHNGVETRLYSTPQIRSDRTFLPVRDIAERFDKEIDWDSNNRTVVIGQGYTAPTAVPRPGTDGRISVDQAVSIAKSRVNGIVTGFEFDDDEYEVEIYLNGYEYEIEINAYTGAITDVGIDEEDDIPVEIDLSAYRISQRPQAQAPVQNQAPAQVSGRISPERARQIALDRAGEGTIVDFEYDDDEYEIEIRQGRYEIEIEIDARTGNIIEFEREIDD